MGDSILSLPREIVSSDSIWLISNYIYLSATVLCIQDWVQTFPTELGAIWQRNLTSTASIFLLNKYLVFLWAVAQFILLFTGLSLGISCRVMSGLTQIALLLCNALTGLLLTLRVYALCQRRKIILAVFSVFLLSRFALDIAIIVTSQSSWRQETPSGTFSGCRLAMLPRNSVRLQAADCCVALTFNLVLISMTVHMTYISVRERDRLGVPPGITYILLRDGVMYFLNAFSVVFTIECIQAATSITSLLATNNLSYTKSCFGAIVSSYTVVLPNMLVNRLFLNLRTFNMPVVLEPSFDDIPEPTFAQNRFLGNIGLPLDSDWGNTMSDDDRVAIDSQAPLMRGDSDASHNSGPLLWHSQEVEDKGESDSPGLAKGPQDNMMSESTNDGESSRCPSVPSYHSQWTNMDKVAKDLRSLDPAEGVLDALKTWSAVMSDSSDPELEPRNLEQMCDLLGIIPKQRLARERHGRLALALDRQVITSCQRYVERGQTKDLQEAISSSCRAISLRPPGHRLRSRSLEKLVEVVHICIDQGHAIECNSTTVIWDMLREAASDITTTQTARVSAAREWTHLARDCHHRSLPAAYTTFLTLLEHELNVNPSLEGQQEYLGRHFSSFASDAAASAIACGRATLAVELLERGRTLLWSKMRGYRACHDGLPPEFAQSFKDICKELELLATSATSLERVSHRTEGDKWTQQRALAARLEDVIRQIHLTEGFDNFLRTTPYPQLREAAAEGPVIVVNLSRIRCDALIVLREQDKPIVVSLARRNSAEELLRKVAELNHEINIITDPRRREEDCMGRMHSVLEGLWVLLVEPVISCLLRNQTARLSRIWWCPTGSSCNLPLHAARPPNARELGYADLYVPSYIPTLGSLITSRANTVPRVGAPRLLVIGEPDGSLPMIAKEIHIVRESGEFVQTLLGESVTRDAVLAGLRSHQWAHLACHGHLRPNPFHSYLRLHKRSPLRIIDIVQARLPDAEFAFLSACHTATMGQRTNTPDEAVHLAAALQFSGFRSVVGTLWGMADDDGPILAEEFYAHMFRHGPAKADFKDAAMALRVATKALRRKGVPVDRWINFIHIGA